MHFIIVVQPNCVQLYIPRTTIHITAVVLVLCTDNNKLNQKANVTSNVQPSCILYSCNVYKAKKRFIAMELEIAVSQLAPAIDRGR